MYVTGGQEPGTMSVEWFRGKRLTGNELAACLEDGKRIGGRGTMKEPMGKGRQDSRVGRWQWGSTWPE